MNRIKNSRKPDDVSRTGAATVELALVLPILVFFLLVVVDFARVFHFSIVVSNCARNAALYACDARIFEHSSYGSLEEVAFVNAEGLDPQPTITVVEGEDEFERHYVEVTVTYLFQTITKFPGIPRQVTIARTVRLLKTSMALETGNQT